MIRRLILCASLMLLSVGVFAQTYGLTLEDNIANPNIMVNISKYYGGSVDYIALKKANGAWTANLVQSGSGLNLQAAFYRIGDNVAQNLDPALQNDQEDWEKQDPATQLAYEPTCMDNAGAQKFLWNPTQAGMQPGCGDPYNLFDPSQCFQPDNGGMCESFSSAITYDSQGNPQVHYIIKYAPWVTYDHVYDFYPQYTYEGSVWEDCTVTLSSGTPGAYSIHFDSAWRLSRQDYFGNVVHTTQQLYFSDRDFYGSGSLQTSYKFDSSYAGDPYHMRKCTNLPAYATGGGSGGRSLEAIGSHIL